MTDQPTEPTAPAIQFLDQDTDGYCDPVTGVCVLPGAAQATPSAQPADDAASGE